ncbi:uncharacterized protein LOC111319474 [Stylophora pistillata]|uniref:BTB/POZ domain-containing protein KCTD6 n=1 Tax=Stylophora pistillata TaxID=50429 RepID=A0A2B4QZJ9_STYPI|nr:uncharacterized protein LOC111319474 [Stylophora pistillata]PFX11604.1 BTB/POZ domain-containing protein KCTD6 [Stylophora pistillata]
MSKNTNSEGQKEQKHELEDAEKFFKDACEIFQREAVKLRQEREAIDDMSKKLEHVHFSSTVKLNVGGHHFTTSLQTLTKDPNSMLAAMFSGKFEMKPAEDGAYFIDRDGTHFRFILNYLRNGELILPDGATFLKELEAEAKFYQIRGILEELNTREPKYFEDSVILTNEEHRSVLNRWLSPQDGKWKLLFRGSRDGFEAQTFHSKCDNRGPTVTIVKSGNYIFGGFSEKSWDSSGRWFRCSQAFLFSMVNTNGLGPTKLQLFDNHEHAIYCETSCGPTFGEGHDLYISGDANVNSSSFACLGNSYQCPTGQVAETFLAGSGNFTVTDYEVFELQK